MLLIWINVKFDIGVITGNPFQNLRDFETFVLSLNK